MHFARVYRGFAFRIWQLVQIVTGLVAVLFLAGVGALLVYAWWHG